MATKGLGQIHTVNYDMTFNSNADVDQLDLSGELSKQLQHHVRQGNYFKVVGIDMNVTEFGGNLGGGQVTGYLDYYNPTRGRCEAFRAAFDAMRNAMKTQGISMSKNSGYDFRVNLTDQTFETTLINAATLDGTRPLTLEDNALPSSIFYTHNRSVDPVQQGTPNFSPGFGVYGSATDFVLEEGDIGFTGNSNYASSEFESIPFQLSYDPTGDNVSFSMEWRPDPALYIAVMCGLIRVRIDELEFDGDATDLKLSIAVHVAGWKSIMGNPDKKSRRASRSKKTLSHKNGKK